MIAKSGGTPMGFTCVSVSDHDVQISAVLAVHVVPEVECALRSGIVDSLTEQVGHGATQKVRRLHVDVGS